MPNFSCKNCGLAISIMDAEVDKEVCCPGCKMAQLPPTEVRRTVAGAQRYFGRLATERAKIPEYILAVLTSFILIVAGAFAILAGLFQALSAGGLASAWVSLLGGIVLITLAQVLEFARQIARQTYKHPTDM